MTSMKRINCRTCKYYYITWDSTFPNGCKAYGIKSREMPSVVVYKSSSEECKYFDSKVKTNQ